jgi:uncharacterized protein
MPVYFIDSSALVKRYRREAGSAQVADIVGPAERLIVSRLTQVDVSSAIVRRGRATGLSAQELAEVLGEFERDLEESLEIVELNAAVFRRAVEMTRKHALRAADAIQLACALLAQGDLPSNEITVLASDQELNAAARFEGLPILNPTQP